MKLKLKASKEEQNFCITRNRKGKQDTHDQVGTDFTGAVHWLTLVSYTCDILLLQNKRCSLLNKSHEFSEKDN